MTKTHKTSSPRNTASRFHGKAAKELEARTRTAGDPAAAGCRAGRADNAATELEAEGGSSAAKFARLEKTFGTDAAMRLTGRSAR